MTNTSSKDSRVATYEHIQTVQKFMNQAIKLLMDRALVHDQSKLQTPEREMFDIYTEKLKDLTYGSEEYEKCRQEMLANGGPLNHHYEHNSHHPEHYEIVQGFEKGILGMDLFDLLEMICDWMAAVQRHDDGDIYASLAKNKDRFGYGEILDKILHNTVATLKNNN